MSDLAEIAAAAGIAIIDEQPGDGGDADHPQASDSANGATSAASGVDSTAVSSLYVQNSGDSSHISQVMELEASFSNRYSDSDADYQENVANSDSVSKPPTVTDFYHRRQRDDSRNWNRNRDRGGRGYHHDRSGDRRGGGYYQNDRSHDYNRGWDNRGDRNYPRNHGDYHQRDDSHRHRQMRRDRSPHR